MDKNMQAIFLLTSHFLQYPEVSWAEEAQEAEQLCRDIPVPQIREGVSAFFGYIAGLTLEKRQEEYVRIFDFSKNTNLYLSAHLFEDQKERSQELLRYKELFLAGGFDLQAELPDYLPAILEFCARADVQAARRLLQFCRSSIEALREKLLQAECVQVLLLDSILTAADLLEGEASYI